MKMDNHIMVDCETASTANNALILSIGAVQFSLSSGEVRNTLYLPIDLEYYSGYSGKFHVDPSTLHWWVQQDPKVLKEAFVSTVDVEGSQVRWPIYNALSALSEFCKERSYAGPPIIWSNDETADCVWLESAYAITKQALPWSYQSHRCFRTATEFARELGFLDEVYARNQVEDLHHPEVDAKWQAQVVLDIFRMLGDKNGRPNHSS